MWQKPILTAYDIYKIITFEHRSLDRVCRIKLELEMFVA